MSTDSISKHNQSKWAYIWVAYTAFIFIQPIMEPTLRNWLIAFGALAVFLCIFANYVRCSDAHRPDRYWMIVATFVLGLIVFPFNPGATTFFVYAAAFLPFSLESTSTVLTLFGVESLFILAEGYIFHVGWPNTFTGVFLVIVIGGGNIFFAQEKRADRKLRMAHEEIEALAALAERERIARDLHDVLGHTLSLIVLKAELAGRLLHQENARDRELATEEIADVERAARTALSEVREAIGGYRARGLVAEIETARRTLDAAGVSLITDASPHHAAELTAAEETVLALALREAVTNIVRHARATTCHLRFVSEGGHRRLLVEDDGEHALLREGNGLRGMRERVEAIGGHVSMERERGTRLLIELPLRVEGVVS